MKLRMRQGEFQVIENGEVTFQTPDYDEAILRMGLLEVDEPILFADECPPVADEVIDNLFAQDFCPLF